MVLTQGQNTQRTELDKLAVKDIAQGTNNSSVEPLVLRTHNLSVTSALSLSLSTEIQHMASSEHSAAQIQYPLKLYCYKTILVGKCL